MKTLELTQDDCKLIAEALESQLEKREAHNRMLRLWDLEDVAQEYIYENNTKIGELKTLLDYINS